MKKVGAVAVLVVVGFACSEQAGQVMVDAGEMMRDAGDVVSDAELRQIRAAKLAEAGF